MIIGAVKTAAGTLRENHLASSITSAVDDTIVMHLLSDVQ